MGQLLHYLLKVTNVRWQRHYTIYLKYCKCCHCYCYCLRNPGRTKQFPLRRV